MGKVEFFFNLRNYIFLFLYFLFKFKFCFVLFLDNSRRTRDKFLVKGEK